MLRPRLALALLAGLAILTASELVAGGLAYRDTLTPERWAQVQAGLDPELPILVGTAWLEPVARQELATAAEPGAMAPPDLRGLDRYQVLSYRGRDELHDRLLALSPELPAPEVERRQRFGPLAVTTYAQPAGPRIMDDLLGHWHPRDTRLAVEGGRCSAKDAGFSCRGRGLPLATADLAFAEIGGRARRCINATMYDGVQLRATIDDFRFGDTLRGHVGFAGMNARLRSDAPVTVTVSRGDTRLGSWTFTDDQGWAELAVHTPPGPAPLIVEVQSAVGGVWGRQGYTGQTPHPVCFELRALATAADPAPAQDGGAAP